jgi:hypothetical protein
MVETEVERVKSLLCEGGMLAAINEDTEFLTGPDSLMELLDGLPTRNRRQLLKDLSNNKSIATKLLRLGESCCRSELEHLARLLSDPAFTLRDRRAAVRTLVHFLFDRVAVAAGAAGWLEHSPNNIFQAGRLLEVFEDGLFIFVARDQSDADASGNSRQSRPMSEAFGQYKERHDRWLRSRELIKSGAAKERLIEIDFRDAISSRGGFVRHILKRLGISAGEELKAGVHDRVDNELKSLSLNQRGAP